MPEEEIKKRGGAKRWRTKKLPGGKYTRIAVTEKAGPRGGHTVAGPVRTKKREDMTPREKIEAGLQEERQSHDKKSQRRR